MANIKFTMNTALIPLKILVLLQKLPCFVQNSSYSFHIKENQWLLLIKLVTYEALTAYVEYIVCILKENENCFLPKGHSQKLNFL